MHKGLLALGLTIVFAFMVCGCGGATSPASTSTPSPTPAPTASPTPAPSPTPAVPAVDHVFLVVLENHGFDQVIGSPAMPYLNSLAAQHALAMNFFSNTHPSIGNYFMLTTGQLETNDDAFAGVVTDDNLVRALFMGGKTWKAYMQSLPSTGYLGSDVYPYFKRHNPFSYFSDVVNSAPQALNILPFSALQADVSAGTLPDLVYLSPNVENDAHDCPAGGSLCADADKLAAADSWLRTNLDPLITNPSLANSVFIIDFDEALDSDITHGGGRIPVVIVGADVKVGFQSTTFYQHQSICRLMVDLLRLVDHPGLSATAPTMEEFFQ